MSVDYDAMDGVAMAEAVRGKKISAQELLQEAIARVERLNPSLNAVVTRFDERARREAQAQPDGEAPLAGVPFLAKDLAVALAGEPLRNGSRAYREFIPSEDSELAVRWRRAGLVTFGRTSTSEFGIQPTSEPELYGAAHNPWRRGHSTGGSSGGAAAVVAAGIVPLAHAGDGGGSIRIPAACCGVFGFKPSRGTVPCGPHISEQLHGYAIQHAVSRSVRDSATLLDATYGADIYQPYAAPPLERPLLEELQQDPRPLKIALWTEPLVPARAVTAEVAAAVRRTAKRLEALGHHVEEAKPSYDMRRFSQSFFRLFCCYAAGEVLHSQRLLGRTLRREDTELVSWIGAMFGRGMSGGEFSLALRDMQEVMRGWARFFTEYDVLLTPVVGRTAPPHGFAKPKGAQRLLMEAIAKSHASALASLPQVIDKIVSNAYDFSPFTMFANAGGLPSMSVPLDWSDDGLPIGSLFTAKLGDDARLFQLAAQLERAHNWHARRPPQPVSG